MEYQSLRQFRADLKTAFDYVEAGAEEGDLTIERDGTVFKLVLESWKAPEELQNKIDIETNKLMAKPLPEIKEELKKIIPVRESKLCKDGHPIPQGRDKCLWKGCKYG